MGTTNVIMFDRHRFSSFEGYTPTGLSGHRKPMYGRNSEVKKASKKCLAESARGLTLGQAAKKLDACMVRALSKRHRR